MIGGADEPADLECGWALEGHDASGDQVRLVFGDSRIRGHDAGLTLGRHPALCDLVVDDASVSRRHLRLSLVGDEMTVEDLNALNGTYLDDTPLAPFTRTPVRAGQVLALGAVTVTVVRLTG